MSGEDEPRIGPDAGAKGPDAGAKGPAAGAKGPAAGAKGPGADAKGPAAGAKGRAAGGEHRLPQEHTARVQARGSTAGRTGADDAAERALKARRRARDDRAERRAAQAVVMLFLGLGGLGFIALNFSGSFGAGSGGDDDEPGAAAASDQPSRKEAPSPPTAAGAAGAAAAPSSAGSASGPARGPARQATEALDEVPDLPALGHLERTGLTVGAEGIPRVETEASGDVAPAAGLEACRFAYGVWEFSANQTFRFISTCRGLGRLELIGAYEVRQAEIHLSELTAGASRWTSVFEVEKPSTMIHQVVTRVAGRPVRLEVSQRVTVVRGGLHGDAFRDSFKRKNRLTVPPPVGAAPDSTQKTKSALEELLGG